GGRALVRKAGAEKELRPAGHVAFKAHLREATIEPGRCEIYSYPGGYGGCNEVEGGVVNLCFITSSRDARRFGSDADAVLRNVVFKNRRAAEVMASAKPVGDWLAVPVDRYGIQRLDPIPGLIAVG